MDLQLFARVLWRFRLLVAFGLLLAAALAVISLVRVGPNGVAYRQQEQWSSASRLLVTQQGFPWGRAVAEQVSSPEEQARQLGVQFANPDRFISLAVLYAQLATSDGVRDIMLEDGPIGGQVMASPVTTQQNVALPIVDLVGIAPYPGGAVQVAERATRAISLYLRRQQETNQVPPENRIVVQVLSRPKAPVLFEGRSLTLPIVVFMTAMIATIGLAFVLENLRPRIRPISETTDVVVPDATRRSA